jgi:transposase
MKEEITLHMKEQNKIQVIALLSEGRMELSKAQEILQCSERSLYRWKACLSREGPAGFVHGNKGQKSPHKTLDRVRDLILKLRKELYQDTNDSHFNEFLAGTHGIKIGRSTLRRILRSHDVPAKQKRRPPRFRTRRERKEAFGAMLQLDASYHQWFGALGPWLTLHGAIDDATSTVWAVIEERETTNGYFELLRCVLGERGLPLSLYTDRHSIFYPVMEKLCDEGQRRGEKSESQFGRAMRELGVTLIPAYTPQAKGRIERLWRTFQDRLVVELRLAEIRDKAGMQKFLPGFLQRFNQKYALPAKQRDPVFRISPRKTVLDDIFCRKEFRVVNNDHTVSYNNRILQIQRSKGWRTLAKKTVEVWDRQDGLIKIAYGGQVLQTFQPNIEEVLHHLVA